MAERPEPRVPDPRVTVGMPIYNGEAFVREALDSLLGQTLVDFELLISDNASEDATRAICEEYAGRDPRIRYVRSPKNVGAAPNYNVLVDRARGRFFKWAAHDDVLAPEFLERCVGALEAEPDVVVAYPRTRYMREDGTEIRTSTGDLDIRGTDPLARVRQLIDHEIDGDDVLMSVFGLFRTDALRRTGRIGSYPASDQVLMFELAMLGGFRQVDAALFFRRLHEGTSMAANRTPHAQARWFDASERRRVILPMWGLWRAHNRALARSGLPFGQRLRGYGKLASRFLRMPGALAGELKKAVFQLFRRD